MSVTTGVYHSSPRASETAGSVSTTSVPTSPACRCGSPFPRPAPCTPTRPRPAATWPYANVTPSAPWRATGTATLTVLSTPPDSDVVAAVRVLWNDGYVEVLGPAHAGYFHLVVARHRPEP